MRARGCPLERRCGGCAVTGDGDFGQYATKLTTAVKYRISIKHMLLNNHALGKLYSPPTARRCYASSKTPNSGNPH
ncbi:MAG: thiamine pyrophosphate-dependent enzyme [Pseudonocardiaceae bacterium]